MNHVGLVGHITKNPELRYISERPYTSFFLAINRTYRNSQGNVDADFVLCVAWGRVAERIVKFCGKGSLVGIDGKVQCRSFENKEKQRVYITEIITEDVRFYALKHPDRVVESKMDSTAATQPNGQFTLPSEEEELPVST